MRLGILILFLTTASASAQDPVIGFKSVALGASQAEFRAAFPDHVCEPTFCLYDQTNHCYRKPGSVQEGAACALRNTWAGLAVTRIQTRFHEDKLERVSITIRPDWYARVVASSVERWGAPDEELREPLQTRAGATFENRAARWTRGSTALSIRKYGLSIDEGNAVITTTAALARAAERARAAPKAGAKDM